MKKVFLLSLLTAFLTLQCEQANEPVATPDLKVVNTLPAMNQSMGWKLFHEEQQASPGKNVLLSPLSVQTALMMALPGADGSTQSEINDVIDNLALPENLLGMYSELAQELQNSGHPEVTLANAYFYDDNRIAVEANYLATLQEHYSCQPEILDFRQEQESVEAINDWVATQTNDKITGLLDQITAEDVAFLINALYFKADWAAGFSEDLTQAAPFTTASGSTVQADFVFGDREFTTATADGLQMVDLPFRDSTFSLSLIRPETTEEGWPGTMGVVRWHTLLDATESGRAMVLFPKLKLEYKNDLIASLKQMGMTEAFLPGEADFRPMGTALNGGNIYIRQIVHQSVLEIDEKGAEGAAATSIGFGATSAPPVFRFDQPFVLVLRHIPTNTMLFTGYVADPTED